MPTAEVDSRSHNTLPDIFRTINGINLDIGPLDRLRDSEVSDDGVPWGKGEKKATGRSRFPRIILRDALGRELDTFTTLQEAIYRAKWNVKQSGHPKEPIEWRLPKVPAPARPDLTRTFPPVKHPPAHPPDNKLKGRFDSTRVLEFDVDDVGFVRESLQYLPYAPSLSFLRQEILVGPKTYFQIVGTLLLHKKFLSQTEKRNALYNFPGFCSGCMRMGLCYGCERSTEIHFHADKPVKTGGGFTYFKKDRPENEIKSKNPINWKIQHPDQALKKLMEEYAGVELEGAIPEEIKKHLDKHGGHREKIVSHIPDFAREMQAMNDKEKLLKGDDQLTDIHVGYGDEHENEDDMGSEGEGEGQDGRRCHDLDVKDVTVHIQGQDDIDEGNASDGYQGQQRLRDGWETEQPGHLAVLKSGARNRNKSQSGMPDDTLNSGYITSDDESYRDGSYDRQGHRLPRYRRAESGSDEENDEREQSDTENGSPRRSRRKEKLYTAPAPFKLKKSPKRSIMSKSPFSTDRVYDLPKGKAFEVKKSDRPPTEFKEFRNVDASWKEPKKFELKKVDRKTTKFWSGPPKKKEKKKGGKSHGLRRVPSPRSVSPDSGLDSEFLTAFRRQPPAGKYKTTDTAFKREPLLEEQKYLMDDHILVPTDGEQLDDDQIIPNRFNETESSIANKNQNPQNKIVQKKFQQKVNEEVSSADENSEVKEFRDGELNAADNETSSEGDDEFPNTPEVENEMGTSSEVKADLNDDKDDEHNQPRPHKHSRKRKKSVRQGKKENESRVDGELSLSESDNQLDNYSYKLGSQSSRYRGRSQQLKSGTTQISDGSQPDDLSYYSTNQNSLDGFHDTATEYYKDFDIEAFQRKQNLREQLRKSPRKLPPLTHKTQDHSDADDSWNEATEGVKRLYEGHMTLSDLESETSIKEMKYGGSDKSTARKTKAGLRQFKEGKRTGQLEKPGVSTRDVIFRHKDIDYQRKYKYSNISENELNENNAPYEEEDLSQLVLVKTSDGNTMSINQARSSISHMPPRKMSEGHTQSGTASSRSVANSPRMYTHGNTNKSNRNRSRSLIIEYQKLYQQQHFKKSDSLPAAGIEIKSDKTESQQRSMSVGHFTPYFGSPNLYDKHARGSSSKSRKSFSRGSRTTQKYSRSESISEELEDTWIKDDANRRRQMTLKVPTGRRESFMSTAQSQFTGSYVDYNCITDPIPDGDTVDNVKEAKSGMEREGTSRSNKNLITGYGHSVDSSHRQSESHGTENSPPLIPSDIDHEKGSLTSQEPDLELAFDDVIDVENLEVLEDPYENGDTEKQKKLERKRRHKHRKHRKRKKDQLKTLEDEIEEIASDANALEGKGEQKMAIENMEDANEAMNNEIKADENENDSNDIGHLLSEEDDALNIVARENWQDDVQKIIGDDKTGKGRRQMKKKHIDDYTDLDFSERDASFEKARQTRSRHRKPEETKSRKHTDASFDSRYETEDSPSEEDVHSELFDVGTKERRQKQALIDDGHKLEDGKTNRNNSFTVEEEESAIVLTDNKRKEKKRTNKKQMETKYAESNEGDQTNDQNEFDRQKENERYQRERKKQTVARKKRSRDRKHQGTKNSDFSGKPVRRGREKLREEKRDNLSDDEIDFNQLPSIKSQLAKIFEIQSSKIENEDADVNKSDGENSLSETEKEDDIDQMEGTESEYRIENHLLKHKRPKSANRNNFLGVLGINKRMGRSMSLPLLTDLETLHQNMGDITLEQLKAPLRVPVYLPAFSQGRVIVKKQFKANPKRVIGREKRSMSLSVVTLTPQLPFDLEDTTNKSELEPVREESLTATPDMGLSDRGGTPLQLRVHSPSTDKPPRSVSPPKKREIIKKVKKQRSPVPTPVPPPKPPTPVQEKTPSPVEEERPVSREITFDFVKEKSIPELPPIEVPELPEILDKQSEYKGIKKERKIIEVTPEVPEPKKKLPPPPKLAPRIKTRTSRKSKVAEAPVTSQELQQLSDPLDFLAKYCIINPDRLPYYERVFNSAVNIQTPRYTRDQTATHGAMVHLPPAQLSDHELNMLKDLTVITHAQTPRREGLSMPEQYLEKLNYSLEFIKTKQETILDHMHQLQGEKIRLMAQMAKQLDRDIVRVDYKTKGGKKKKKDDDDDNVPKKKKKKKTEEPDYDTMGAMSVPKNFRPQRASDITDEVIVSRMDDKMMKKVKKDPTVKNFNMQINRDIEKLKHFDQRLAQVEDEKDLVGLYCMDYYFNEQNESAPPYAFRRQQSRLYQKLHPDPDIEMNMDEVETSLQQINNKLLSEREFQYIYFILDLPKREKINFRLFSIIAALSEKVTQMDPVIRKLINKVDYNALDIKMDKSKELFELIQDESLMPLGNAPADTLAVELTAGGLTPEHTNYVLSKFNREGRGFVDFLDFVTYIPLFIEIHKRIIKDPFNETLDV